MKNVTIRPEHLMLSILVMTNGAAARTLHDSCFVFFFNDTATTEIYTLSLHDALPICRGVGCWRVLCRVRCRWALRDGVYGDCVTPTRLSYWLCILWAGRMRMSVSVLDREMYSEAGAARLLGVPQRTLNYWLEGGERRGKTYRPVIRLAPRGGSAAVTWAEFIEAGLLREYRRTHGVPMAELRYFIDMVRERTSITYPLADQRPFVSGRQLLLEAQDEARLDPDFCLVATVRGQLLLTPAADSFVKRVTWEGDVAAAWRPHDDPLSPVRMEPGTRFGRPAVRGISTDALWEHAETGETPEEIAEEFNIAPVDVRWALAY